MEAFSVETNFKVHYKSSDLLEIMKGYLGKNMNLARIKFITLMIMALCLRMKSGGQSVKTDRLDLAHSHNHKGYKLYSSQIHIFTQITFHYLK